VYAYRQFCERLRDDDFNKKCVLLLRNLGGANPKEAVRRAIGALMLNELQRLFNRTGSKGRQSFLELEKLLKAAIMPSIPCTEKDIEVNIAGYLTNARDRDGGRHKRTKLSNPVVSVSVSDSD